VTGSDQINTDDPGPSPGRPFIFRREITMTTDSTSMDPMTTDEGGTRARVGSTIADAAGTIRSAASDAAERLPEVASATRSALLEVDRQVEAGSDEVLTVGTALSFGMAAGLLLAGANRLLVLSAFVPAALLGLRLLDRTSRARGLRGVLSGSANGRARSPLQDA